MLDFNNILATPGYDFQQFYGDATVTLLQWQTWRKPRGVNWVYMIGVGGGGGGGSSRNNSTSAGGSGGGSSGAQTSLLIPAMFVPDILYIQAGAYGIGGTYTGASAGVAGTAGTPTYVCVEPDTTLTENMTLLFANGGNSGGAGGPGAGAGGAAPVAATIANMPLAGRGRYTFGAGQAGGTGGATGAAGVAITLPFGLMVTGGAGGGGNNGAVPSLGGAISAVPNTLVADAFPLPINPGAVASGATPAGPSGNGFISRNYMFNFGGAGGSASTATAGGNCGPAGNGAPGCGGGGGGGANTTAAGPSKGGDGGPGFVYIISW